MIKYWLSDGRPLKKPFTIYNGEHRYGAAVLAGCETMLAVMAWEEEYADDCAEDEFATSDDDLEKIKIVGFVEGEEDEDEREWTDEDDAELAEIEAGLANGTYEA